MRRPPRAQSTPSRPTLAALLVAALAVAVVAAACSEASGSASGGQGEQAASVGRPTTTDQGPDPLPDPGVDPGKCELVTYTPPTASEPFKGELCRPATNQRDVAIMVVHGGSGVGGAYTGMRPWATRLLAEGYVVLLPEYHLFQPGGESPVFPQPEQNVMAAVQFLRGTANALGTRRDRVVVQGMSAGSRLGAVAYTHPDDTYFDGAELWPDISHEVDGFIGFYHTYDGSMQYSDQYYGGSDVSKDAKVRRRWDEADSMAAASSVIGPALFVTGGNDWNLVVQQQNDFAAAVRKAGFDAETVVIPGGGHGFDQGTATRLSKLGEQAATRVLTWLNQQFPQDPPRSAQSANPDLAAAPTYTGSTPTTYATRKRTSTPTTRYSGTTAPTTVSTTTSTTVASTTTTTVASTSTSDTTATTTPPSSSTTATGPAPP